MVLILSKLNLMEDRLKRVNPLELKEDTYYWLKYIHSSSSEWFLAKITNFTVDGFPWMKTDNGHTGIVTPGTYEMKPAKDNIELTIMAENYIRDKGLDSSLFDMKALISMLVDFGMNIEPK